MAVEGDLPFKILKGHEIFLRDKEYVTILLNLQFYSNFVETVKHDTGYFELLQ